MKPTFRKSSVGGSGFCTASSAVHHWRNRIILFVAITAISLISQWILLEDSFCNYSGEIQEHRRLVLPSSSSSTARGERNSHGGTSPTSTTSRLPSRHRRASASECLKNVNSFRRAPESAQPKLSLKRQRAFALGGYNQIARGSGEVHTAGPILNLISKVQHGRGLYGTLAELGVHHGRFTGFLFITARLTEKLVAGDLFEQLQHRNVDKSGLGDKRRFLKGLETYGYTTTDLHTLFEGSTDELPFDWSEKAGFEPFRMISVDASHT